MAKQIQLDIFADIKAKRAAAESKKKFTHLMPDGSHSPTGVKKVTTRELLERKLEILERGDAPFDNNSFENFLFLELVEVKGYEHAKASGIMNNMRRRIMDAYCYHYVSDREAWGIVKNGADFRRFNVREYCNVLRKAIELPAEHCSDT